MKPETWAKLQHAYTALLDDAAEVRETSASDTDAAAELEVSRDYLHRTVPKDRSRPDWVKVEILGPQHIAAARAYWTDGTAKWRPKEKTRPRDIRFASVGQLTGDAWQKHMARLLNGELPEALAPVLRERGNGPAEVRYVQRAEVDWAQLEARDWRAFTAMGMRREVQDELLSLTEGDEEA